MAIEIDLTRQLTAFELQYLVDRNRWDDLRKNAENLGVEEPNMPSARGLRAQVPRRQLRNTDTFDKIADQLGVKIDKGEDPVAVQEKAGPVDYSKLTVPQLKEELDKRRAEYEAANDAEAAGDVTYTADAKKPDLIGMLEYDDEASNEAEGTDGGN